MLCAQGIAVADSHFFVQLLLVQQATSELLVSKRDPNTNFSIDLNVAVLTSERMDVFNSAILNPTSGFSQCLLLLFKPRQQKKLSYSLIMKTIE